MTSREQLALLGNYVRRVTAFLGSAVDYAFILSVLRPKLSHFSPRANIFGNSWVVILGTKFMSVVGNEMKLRLKSIVAEDLYLWSTNSPWIC